MGSTKYRLASLGLAGLMALSGVSVAAAGGQESLACTIRVDVPNSSNDAIVGRSGCSNTIPGTGFIREDRTVLPDDTVGSRTFDAGLATVNGSCGNGRGSYYSQFNSSSGASAQSSRAIRC